MNELKPCPFCGGVNIIYNHWHAFYCHGCGVEGPDADNRDEAEALAAWNARAIAAEVLANPPAGAVGEGWKLVPMEPTPEMIRAGGHVNSEWLNDNAPLGEVRYAMPMQGVYAAMLAATPPAADAPPSPRKRWTPEELNAARERANEYADWFVSKAPPIPSASDTASGAVGVLREALEKTAQALAWKAFGECRGFHASLPTPKDALDAARAALSSTAGATGMGAGSGDEATYSGWLWTHNVRGGEYRMVGSAKLQTDKPLMDMAEVVVYRGADGRLWVRAADEWDARFKRVRPDPSFSAAAALASPTPVPAAVMEDKKS